MTRHRAREMIAMRMNGMRNVDIARAMNCSPANVCATLKRHKDTMLASYGDPMTPAHVEFIEEEARKAGVNFETMARAILVDALEEMVHVEQNVNSVNSEAA